MRCSRLSKTGLIFYFFTATLPKSCFTRYQIKQYYSTWNTQTRVFAILSVIGFLYLVNHFIWIVSPSRHIEYSHKHNYFQPFHWNKAIFLFEQAACSEQCSSAVSTTEQSFSNVMFGVDIIWPYYKWTMYNFKFYGHFHRLSFVKLHGKKFGNHNSTNLCYKEVR